MGRKKDRKAAEATAAMGAKAAPFAGFAAMALRQVAGQVNSPAGRQAMAAGLRAAADLLTRKDVPPARAANSASTPDPARAPDPAGAPSPVGAPRPPEPPVPPSPFAGDVPEPPRTAGAALPPEVAQMVDSVAAGLQRWAAKLGQPQR